MMSTRLELVLDEIIIERPEDIDQHLCADRGYDYPSARQCHNSKRIHSSSREKARGRDSAGQRQPRLESKEMVVDVSLKILFYLRICS
jgi:hypothetical protein